MRDETSKETGPDEARYKAESRRLLDIILSIARKNGVSIRSLERQVGIGDSVFAKVLSGKVTPQLRHIFLMCDGLGIEWGEFFSLAYLTEEKAKDEEKERFIRILMDVGLLPPDYLEAKEASPKED
jgi:transcriptional regulator with XRE-family HTH domain